MLSSIRFITIKLLEFGYFVLWKELLCSYFVKVGCFKTKDADVVEALLPSRLNMPSTSAFVKNRVGSSDKLAGYGGDRLSALTGVVTWTGSSRIGLTTSGAGLQIGTWVA